MYEVEFNSNKSVINNNNTDVKTIFKNMTISVLSGTGQITENDGLMAEVIFDNCVVNYNGNTSDLFHQGSLIIKNNTTFNYNVNHGNISTNGGQFSIYDSKFIANSISTNLNFTDNVEFIDSYIVIKGSSNDAIIPLNLTGKVVKNNIFEVNKTQGFIFNIADTVSGTGEFIFNVVKVDTNNSSSSITLTNISNYEHALVDMNILKLY